MSKSVKVSGGGTAIITAQHWKGCTFPTYSDTAYSKINKSKGLKNTSVGVVILGAKKKIFNQGNDDYYVNVEAGYAHTVKETRHTFNLKNKKNTLVYTITGTQS